MSSVVPLFADQLDRLIGEVQASLDWEKRFRLALLTHPPKAERAQDKEATAPAKRGGLWVDQPKGDDETYGAMLLRLSGNAAGRAANAEKLATQLLPTLSRIGFDTTPLRRVMHRLRGGGGRHRALEIWEDLKVLLQSLADRERGAEQRRLKPRGERKSVTQKPNPRNKFCYDRMAAGDSLQSIKNRVNARATWEPLLTVQGVSEAAKRHARLFSLRWPIR